MLGSVSSMVLSAPQYFDLPLALHMHRGDDAIKLPSDISTGGSTAQGRAAGAIALPIPRSTGQAIKINISQCR